MHDDEKGPGFWKFNCSLLKDEQYVDKVKKNIAEITDIEQNQNPGVLWEAIKLNIRTQTISYCVKKKRSNNNILEVLHRRLERLYTRFEQNPNDQDKIDIELIKKSMRFYKFGWMEALSDQDKIGMSMA